MDQWIQLWASELGYSLSNRLGWDVNGPVWVAEAQFFTVLTNTGYCFHSIVRHADVHHMAAKNAAGLFVKERILFPVMVTPSSPDEVGHWFYICLKPNQEVLEFGDSLRVNRSDAVAQMSHLWDDICTFVHGFNNNAQSWPSNAVQ
jgi:hypothetical protein